MRGGRGKKLNDHDPDQDQPGPQHRRPVKPLSKDRKADYRDQHDPQPGQIAYMMPTGMTFSVSASR